VSRFITKGSTIAQGPASTGRSSSGQGSSERALRAVWPNFRYCTLMRRKLTGVVAIQPAAKNVDDLRRNMEGLVVEAICAALASRTGASKIVDPGLGHWGFARR